MENAAEAGNSGGTETHERATVHQVKEDGSDKGEKLVNV